MLNDLMGMQFPMPPHFHALCRPFSDSMSREPSLFPLGFGQVLWCGQKVFSPHDTDHGGLSLFVLSINVCSSKGGLLSQVFFLSLSTHLMG